MNREVLTENIQRIIPDALIVETSLQLCPELKLYLISLDNIQRSFSEKEIRVILENTPYWTFCWAGGQALAYYILQSKNQLEEKCILDFGSGSGVGAIAAAMAGAAKVFACDNDCDALDAIAANAVLNNVQIQTCESFEEISDPIDIIIAADVFYDRENSRFLTEFLYHAPRILIAEARIKSIKVAPYQKVAEITTITMPDSDESVEFKRVNIFQAVVS